MKNMSDKLQKKLQDLPKSPGVYLYKNASGKTIYIGKAAVLRNRVRQYFQTSRPRDVKTDLLIADIVDVDWIEVESEADALFLEAELVRRYMPDYNILLRDDKSLQYIRIDIKSDYPTVTLVRRPLDDGAEYFGPYVSGVAIKRALRCLRKAFPFAAGKPTSKRANLYYHLGLDPGLEEGRTSLNDYRTNLRRLMRYIKGERRGVIKQMEKAMKAAAKNRDFEQAALLRNRLQALEQLNHQILFSDRELLDISKDAGLSGLAQLIGLKAPPRRIEGFDISHQQGTDTVASMVVFSHGLPDKANYRKFKMRLAGNDDFAHMREVLSRRFSDKNRKTWGLPDLILIDGGKGQLSVALEACAQAAIEVPMIGLAKREEEIILHSSLSNPGVDKSVYAEYAAAMNAYTKDSQDYLSILLPSQSDVVKLLQRIRDESHRFAVSYHSTLKRSRQIKSRLDEIPGVGPVTKRKLLRRFGSLRSIMEASEQELIDTVGVKLAGVVRAYLSKRQKVL